MDRKEPIITKSIRMPKIFKEELDTLAEIYGTSTNKLVVEAIQEFLKAQKN